MKLENIFSNGMVIQANKPIKIFGTGKGKAVVSFLGEKKEFESISEKWCIELSPRPYGGPYNMEITLNEEIINIQDIMIGEVLLCAGQSNMALILDATNTSVDIIKDDNLLRAYTAECFFPNDTDISGKWLSCATDTAPKWSALGYLIGRLYRQKFSCAVGIVVAAKGASIIESWINKEYYAGSEFELSTEDLHKYYLEGTSEWNKPGYLYETMLSKLLPYTFGSAVWYQGESNSGISVCNIYSDLLAMFCDCLRKDDMDEELPLCIVQIADCNEPWINANEWKIVQQEQEKAVQKIKKSGLVISKDICEIDNIHPPTKTKLAERIFEKLCALNNI